MTGGSVVLLSGGLDSTVLATWAQKTTPGDIVALSIHYGQRHARELEAASDVAAHLGIEHQVIDLSVLGEHLASALTDPNRPVPEGHYADDNMRATVVPNRNAILLSVAAGVAASRGLRSVQVAVHAGDHPVYPDCRPEFLEAMDDVTEAACDVTILAPYMDQGKDDIVRIGDYNHAPMHLSWSCYQGGERHCGRCGTCVERHQAFRLAGVADPTDYVDADYALAVAP